MFARHGRNLLWTFSIILLVTRRSHNLWANEIQEAFLGDGCSGQPKFARAAFFVFYFLNHQGRPQHCPETDKNAICLDSFYFLPFIYYQITSLWEPVVKRWDCMNERLESLCPLSLLERVQPCRIQIYWRVPFALNAQHSYSRAWFQDSMSFGQSVV